MFRNLLLFISLAFLVSFPAYAKPVLKASLSTAKIAISETVELRIEAEWPHEEAQYAFAFPEIPLNNLALIRQGHSQETFKRSDKEWIKKSFSFELKPTQKGPAAVKAFDLPYIDPMVQKGGRLSVPELELTVTSAPLTSAQLTLASLGVAGGLFAIALIFLSVTRKSKPKNVEITPQEAAVRKFKSLIENAEATDLKEMLSVISAEFRDFLGECFQLSSVKKMDSEVLSELKKKNASIEDREKIERIFNQLQESKFMGAGVTADKLRLLQREILQFIESKKIYGNP